MQKKYDSSLIGMFGLNTEFKLCHLPFLLVNDVYGCLALEGSSGSGKTTLVKRIGQLNEEATGGTVKVFSADKARYEDFIGIPIPDETNGKMKIYPMPNSVAETETVVIDEANRANYENQEKWMSLIATREIDGMQTKCKYLYLAMNPVLGEDGDNYEGVIPLDKAMGERVYALIRMEQFGKLERNVRLEIMKASFNQTVWKPTEEAIKLHMEYVSRAKELYEENKSTLLDKVMNYVDNVQADLRKETRTATSIEARRAQFMVTNILATHALDRVYDNTPIEVSALNALLISFPNRLWEQVIAVEALKMAHDRNKGILKLSDSERKKSVSNFVDLERSLDEIISFAKTKPTKEQISKVINQNLPDFKDDPVNHYVFCIAASKGLLNEDSTGKKQDVMKEQEFSRFEKVLNQVESSTHYKKYVKLMKSLEDNGGKIPANSKDIPEFLLADVELEEIDDFLGSLLVFDIGTYALSVCDITGVQPANSLEFLGLMEKMTDAFAKFKEVKEICLDQ